MKNPWVLLLGLAVVYALSLSVYFSSFQNQAHRWHADKLFHLAGGFLDIAAHVLCGAFDTIMIGHGNLLTDTPSD